ncbi:MAG: peptide chain release factor N(5)-glutamine methyltransferase [Rickettsiales bacterium]
MISLTQAITKLKAAGIATAQLDAEILLAHTLNCTRADLILKTIPKIPDEFLELIERRCAHEPLAYIVGKKEFWEFEFIVNNNVLIPRPDTETLIEQILLKFPDKSAPLRFLDLGTGSGCIILTLLSIFKNASGVAVDISDGALLVAKQNAKNLGIERAEFINSDWYGNIAQQRFDAILANPPYIEPDEEVALEVKKYEPQNALYGGVAPYKIIAANAARYLAPNGIIAVEIGYGQGEQVAHIFSQHGFSQKVVKDLAGKDRIIIAHAL